MPPSPTAGPLPLEGTIVLDLTRHLPGPYATDLLRRLGAEVLKIEPPEGDPTRWLPPLDGDYGALFNLLNAGKRSVIVDLKTDEGKAFLHALARVADVAVESYKPGIAGNFGVDAETLQRINPRLVFCSISGYGSRSSRSGHDANFVALAGLLDLQRDRAGRPVLPAAQIGDLGGALFAALSILAALIERRTGAGGRVIDISMADAARALMPAAEALVGAAAGDRAHFFLTGALPSYSVYRTSDDQFLMVAALESHFWRAFCVAIGRPELIDLQADPEARAGVFATIRDAIASRSRAEWEAVFAQIDACVEPVLSIEEAHRRMGGPEAAHPLQQNFFSAPVPVDAPGASLDRAAEIAGFGPEQRRALQRGAAFQFRNGLRQRLASAARRVRNQQPEIRNQKSEVRKDRTES